MFFFSHWNEVFILWWRPPLPWQGSRNTWGFQKYLDISYSFGHFSLRKDCEDQEFPPAFTPSNPTTHFLAGNQAPAEWRVVFLASCCFLEIFSETHSSDERTSILNFTVDSFREIIFHVFPMISKQWNYKLEFFYHYKCCCSALICIAHTRCRAHSYKRPSDIQHFNLERLLCLGLFDPWIWDWNHVFRRGWQQSNWVSCEWQRNIVPVLPNPTDLGPQRVGSLGFQSHSEGSGFSTIPPLISLGWSQYITILMHLFKPLAQLLEPKSPNFATWNMWPPSFQQVL